MSFNPFVKDGGGGDVYKSLEAGVNITIEKTADGKAKISASGEVSSEDTVARTEIAQMKDGANIDSFGDVEVALEDKADSNNVYSKSDIDTALDNKADKSTVYTKTEVDTALGDKQNTISDLSTIRSGAALGATAVQPETGKGLSTNDYTTSEKTKLAGIAEGAEVNEIEGIKINNTTVNPDANKVVNITIPTKAADVSALPNTTKYAAALSLTINSSTFVVTGQLIDQDGDNLGTAQTIDLPLESVVVDGSYNSQTKKVVLTLQNGNTIEFSVADLVSGLQTELSASNKLNPAYIDYDSTHRAVSDTEKSTWNGKQSALDSTQLAAVNSGITSADVEQIATNENNISTANAELIELVDSGAKNLVNSTSGTGTRWVDIPVNIPAGDYAVSFATLTTTWEVEGNQLQLSFFDSNYDLVTDKIVYINYTTKNGVYKLNDTCKVIRLYASPTSVSGKVVTYTNMMLCSKSAWDVSQKFVPYRPTYEETVEQVATNENNILLKIGASDYATQNTGGTVRVWTTTSGGETTLHIANEAP